MIEQKEMNYARIAEAINYIRENFRDQPGLEEVAGQVHLSPFHFQKLFTDWVGVSPKSFLQYISVEHAKEVLKSSGATLFDAAFETGLSGTGRLHDLFIKIEGMTPGEYKNGGASLSIHYSFATSLFGEVLVASTEKGICYMAFADDRRQALHDLQQAFPQAHYEQRSDAMQQSAVSIFSHDWKKLPQIKLHLKGTDFQIKVWEALLSIPWGGLTSYRTVACHVNHPNASRAIGTAIGSNPVAFLIPCHRVIKANGVFGGYKWGEARKTALIGWEAARMQA